MEEFAGKTAVVTGAGSGMGKAFALRWGAEGMNVVIGDIQEDALAATVAELEAAGVPVLGLRTDVSSSRTSRRWPTRPRPGSGRSTWSTTTPASRGTWTGRSGQATAKDWDWTLSVNLMSVIYGIRTFVPRMLAHGEPGHVVNTCSMTSVIAATNMYGICKHAILAMTEVLAADLEAAGANVGATGLCPGIIATNLFHGSRNRPPALTDGAACRRRGRSCATTCTRCCLSKGCRRPRWPTCW